MSYLFAERENPFGWKILKEAIWNLPLSSAYAAGNSRYQKESILNFFVYESGW